MRKSHKLLLLSSTFLMLGGLISTFAVGFTPEAEVVEATSPTPCPEDYYDSCEGLTGSSLAAELRSFNKPKSPSYDWSRYEDADEALDDPNSILCVYTRHTIKKSNHCGDYAWDKWNREHVWTQTAWPESKTDNHNIFACEGQINNIRNNFLFNAVTHNSSTRQTVFSHVTDCYFDGDYFEPCDEAKGEIARSVMYGAVMYNRDIEDEIYSVELALQWHLEHPNTERDIRRNNIVHTNQGNRNPFVDNPDYACKIYGNTNAATKALCGSTPIEKTLSSIAVTSSNHRNYYVGDTFVKEEITATYSDGSTSVVTDKAVFSNYTMATACDQTVNVSYTEDGVKKTTSYKITVSERPVEQKLDSITVSNSYRTFGVNDDFIKETVTAHYTGGKADAVVTNSAVFSSVDMSTVGNKTVNVSYTEDGVTKSTSYQIEVIKETIPVTGVQIEVEGQITLDNGQSQTLVATVLPKDATNKNIAWSSNNPSCVLVDNNGKITAKSPGNAIITVRTEDGNFTDTVSVAVNDTEVIPVEKINVTPTELTLDEGAESQLTIEVLPENATNKDVNVTISNSSVVSCDDKFNVKGLKGGSTTITITSVTNEDVNATVNVTVNEKAQPKLVGIEVTNKPNKLVYEVGETFNSDGLAIDAYYLDGTRKSVIPSIISSVDTSTAGKKTVSVFYLEDSVTVSTTFEIMVADKKPVSLLKTSDPIKTTYYSTESVNLFGLKVSAVYADGSKEDISNVLSYETFTVSDVEKDVFLRYMDFDPIIIKLTINSGSPKTEDKAFDYALSFDEKNVAKDTVSLGTWELLEAKFNGLDYSTQSYLKKYEVSQSSKEVSAGNDDEVAKVINIYDDVVMNRKAEGFKDFMGRNPQPKTDSKGYDFIPTILKIVLWSMVGVAALVTLLRLILRKN